MYQSEIANNLKGKIDNEISALINNSKMVSLNQHISSSKSKEELGQIKSEILLNYENNLEKEQELQKQKRLVLTKEGGFINTIILSLVVIFILGIAVGAGYMFYHFGA